MRRPRGWLTASAMPGEGLTAAGTGSVNLHAARKLNASSLSTLLGSLPTTAPAQIVWGDMNMWTADRQIVWGDQLLNSGGQQIVWGDGVVNPSGQQIVWGDQITGQQIVWGDSVPQGQ